MLVLIRLITDFPKPQEVLHTVAENEELLRAHIKLKREAKQMNKQKALLNYAMTDVFQESMCKLQGEHTVFPAMLRSCMQAPVVKSAFLVS